MTVTAEGRRLRRDLIGNLRAAQRAGWPLRIGMGAAMLVADDLEAWVRHGVELQGAARRVRSARSYCRGVRLSETEVARIDVEALAAELGVSR